MLRRLRSLALLVLVLVGVSSHVFASSTGSITITGAEQSTAGIWDLGTVTVSINNYSETVPYGQYSTPDSIAAGIAAKFSSDCNGPANARSIPGGVINIQMKNSVPLSQLSVTASSNLSFSGTTNLSVNPTITTATIGATQLLLGQSTNVAVQVSCNSACGLVDYRIDGGEWGTVALDGNGSFSAGTGSNWPAGLHNVVVRFLGNGTYLPSASNPVSVTISSSSVASAPTPIYNYNISTYAPNSNITAYTDSVNGNWSSLGYDNLNRLTSATYTPIGSSTQYMCWGYDSFGNRTTQAGSNAAFQVGSPSCQPASSATFSNNWASYDPNSASNRVTGTPQLPIYPASAYDAAGNPNQDGVHQYLYDAEGRICASSGPVGMTGYLYNAEGQRVAKGAITTWSCDMSVSGYIETAGYVLGPSGEQVTEVDGNGGWVHTNVYAAGSLIATYQNDQHIHFYLDDWLGTRRVQTDYAGNVEQNCTSNPFGDAPPCIGASEQFFTGKERDTESGLDYFGARYYASSMGRWMSPDWADKPEAVPYSSLDNPQTLNLYGYVGNNPLSHADADGHCDQNGQNCSVWDHVAGALGGALNIVPMTLNVPNQIFNAVSGAFGGPQVTELPMIQADTHASEGGVMVGTAAASAAPMAAAAAEVKTAGMAIGEVRAATAGESVPESIPVGPGARPSPSQQNAINQMGDAHGCTTCGGTSPGTKTGNWVGDHQPPTKLNPTGGPQVYKPQCLQCSRQQGGQVAAAVRAAKKTETTPQ